jgi:pilus assembly protein CpaD
MTFNSPSRLLPLLAVIAALSSAGCTTQEIADETQYVPNSGSEQYPIKVAKGPVSIDVSSADGTLQPAQINRVSAFARQASSAGLTPVTVSRPSGGGKSSRVAYEVANLLAQQGVPAQLIKIRTYRASGSAPVKISYSTTRATVRPCGDWSIDVTNSRSNEIATNHGCAVQSNMAAMIANPNDLLTPRATTPALGSTRVDAVDAVDGNSVSLDPIATTASTATTGAPQAAGTP